MALNLSKDLALAAGIGVVIGLLALSYASSNNNNLGKLAGVPADSPLKPIADEIIAASANGGITGKGIANSLASKVMEAQKALNEPEDDDEEEPDELGEAPESVEKLNDFISEVNAQSGKKITADEATKLISMANDAIVAIQNPAPVCSGTVMPDGTCCTGTVVYDEAGRPLECR